MKIINIFGGPGIGKSTIAAGLFYKMKLAGMHVELVTEYAKDLVYQDRLENMLDQQEYIFAKQNYKLHILRDKVDWIVTDSPILLSYVYPKINQEQKGTSYWPAFDEFKAFVLATVNSYDNLNIMLSRNTKTYQQEGRVHSLTEASIIDTNIQRMLDNLDIKYLSWWVQPNLVDDIFTSTINLKE
jgi:deoxyadenosine/deoxycytidine kinase